jgi:hypothetical protein
MHVNNNGESALAIAERCGHDRGAEVLRKAKLQLRKDARDHKRSRKKGFGGGGAREQSGQHATDEEAQRATAKAQELADAAADSLLAEVWMMWNTY